jgi:hypothetical protein
MYCEINNYSVLPMIKFGKLMMMMMMMMMMIDDDDDDDDDVGVCEQNNG